MEMMMNGNGRNTPLAQKPVAKNRKLGLLLAATILAILGGSIFYIIIFPSL